MSYQIIGQDPDLLFGINCDQGIAGKVFDVSGNGFDADLVGSPQQGRDRFGSFLKFDGVDDYADCGNDGLLNNNDLTILAMLSLRVSPSSYYGVVANGATANNNRHNLSGTPFGQLTFQTSTGVGSAVITSQVLDVTQQYFVCCTRKYIGGVQYLNMYINGANIGYTTLSGAPGTADQNTYLGRIDVTRSFGGNIYAAAIYNKAKSAAWVKQEWERFLAFQG